MSRRKGREMILKFIDRATMVKDWCICATGWLGLDARMDWKGSVERVM